MGAGMGGVRVGWVRSRGGGHPGRFFFSNARREKPRSTWTVGFARTHLARDVVDGEVEVGAQHLERDALGLAAPAFLRWGDACG